MTVAELMNKYTEAGLNQMTKDGKFTEYAYGQLEIAAKLAVIVQAEAALRQAKALEKLAQAVGEGEPFDANGEPLPYLRFYRVRK